MGIFLKFLSKSKQVNAQNVLKSQSATDNNNNSWTCKKCGTHNSLSSLSCKDCGNYK